MVNWKRVQGAKGKLQGNVCAPFLPFGPNSDQHQISPCYINAYSTPEVMRINDMITQGEFSSYFKNFSPALL